MAIARIIVCLFFAATAHAGDSLRIVGSSTVFPFTATVAEQYGLRNEKRVPFVEATGTGAGIKLFCQSKAAPHFVNASRPIKEAERTLCREHGIVEPLEFKIGYDGIALAHSKQAFDFDISAKALFLALAQKVPAGGQLINNPYQTWQDVDKTLPNLKITVYGPPPTSGTRDAFVEILMEKTCGQFPEYKDHHKACKLLREDGAFVEAGENDNIIVQRLKNNPSALGLLGYSFLEQQLDVIKPVAINGVKPFFEEIVAGRYPLARSLFLYAKPSALQHPDGLPLLREYVGLEAMGDAQNPDGYLIAKGFIPLAAPEIMAMRKRLGLP